MKAKYLLKFSFFLLLIISFFSCENKSKKNDDQLIDIKLDLTNKLSFGHFFPQRELAITEDKAIVQPKNIPGEFVDYELKSFTFNIAKEYFKRFKKNEISVEEFQLLQQIYTIDTTQLSNQNLTSKVFMLIGELNNGRRAVVVDTDLNFDFLNEEIIEFEYPIQFIDEDDEAFYEQNKIDFLPKVTVKYGDNATREFVLLIDPYEGDMPSYSNSEKYFLSLSIPNLMTQEFQIKDKSYVLEAKSSFIQVENRPKNFQFVVFEKKDSLATSTELELLRFQLNDTINLNNYDFQLTYNNQGFNFKNLGYNDHPVGVTEGFFVPEIKADFLDGKPYSAKKFSDKFQLFYFWTTWNLASLEDVASLKQLQNEQNNVTIIGVASDANQGAVERMIARQDMSWNTLYTSPDNIKHQNLAVQFKVLSFPTYVLINPSGKIIKRTHHLKEIANSLTKR